jgi:hypothetical protein
MMTDRDEGLALDSTGINGWYWMALDSIGWHWIALDGIG